MKRRDFLQTMGAAAASGMVARVPLGSPAKKLQRIGLETYAVRHAMAENPEQTLAAVRAMGYTDVELLWSFNLFGRTPAQVAATLKSEGLRAPSAHMSADTIFVGWERSLETAKVLGHEFLVVPDFEDWTKQTLDDWREWADRSKDTRLGTGIFDFKKFLAAVPALEQKPTYVEQETAHDAAGDLADAKANCEYLKALEF